MLRAGKLFQRIDTNSDGKITEEDMANYIKRYYSDKDVKKKIDIIFENID